MKTNTLVSVTDAANQYTVPIAAITRMEAEGLVHLFTLDNRDYVLADALRRVVESAAHDLNLLTCACAGPCQCYHCK